MQVIYKYECRCSNDWWEALLPKHAEILALGKQADTYVYWAKVDPTESVVIRRLRLISTGIYYEEVPGERHVGTHYDPVHEFVKHLFDLGEVIQ